MNPEKAATEALLHVLRNRVAHTIPHPFNGPFSGTAWVSRYRKGKTNLDFTEARDSEWQWHQISQKIIIIVIWRATSKSLLFILAHPIRGKKVKFSHTR